jgi:hypothetical protein
MPSGKLQRAAERDVGEIGIPGLQRDDGERGVLHAHEIDGEALAPVEAECVGEVHNRVRHQRRRGMGYDKAQPFGRCGLDRRNEGEPETGRQESDRSACFAVLASH